MDQLLGLDSCSLVDRKNIFQGPVFAYHKIDLRKDHVSETSLWINSDWIAKWQRNYTKIYGEL